MGCATSKGTLSYPKWDDSNKSLLRKYLTKEVFDQLKDKKSSRGISLRQIINSGLVNQHQDSPSIIGVYAGDGECYSLFAPLLRPIIEDYHKPYSVSDSYQPTDFEPRNLRVPNPDPFNKYITLTRILVARNLKGYALTPAMTRQERRDVESKVVVALESLGGELKGKYYPLASINEATREKLAMDHNNIILFEKDDRLLEAAGVNAEWPEGRGIFHNDDKTFMVWVNGEDHLRIISMKPSGNIETAFRRLAKAVSELNDKLGFQFDEHLGYLTASPTNLGTGMRASLRVKLVNAAKSADWQTTLDKYHLLARSSVSSDGAYDISNRRCLGQTEVQCVQDVHEGVKKLLEIEKTMAAAAAATNGTSKSK